MKRGMRSSWPDLSSPILEPCYIHSLPITLLHLRSGCIWESQHSISLPTGSATMFEHSSWQMHSSRMRRDHRTNWQETILWEPFMEAARNKASVEEGITEGIYTYAAVGGDVLKWAWSSESGRQHGVVGGVCIWFSDPTVEGWYRRRREINAVDQ